MVLGYFGKTPCEPDSELVKMASEQLGLQPTTELVVDLNDKDPNKGIEAARKMLKEANLEETEENIFIAAACKEKGIMFLQGKGQIGVRKNADVKQCSLGTENLKDIQFLLITKIILVRIEGTKKLLLMVNL